MSDRHAFQILEQLGPEADRLGIKVVDVYGQSGPASEFLSKIIRYIEAREAEIERLRLTDEEREAVSEVVDCLTDSGTALASPTTTRNTLAALLERMK